MSHSDKRVQNSKHGTKRVGYNRQACLQHRLGRGIGSGGDAAYGSRAAGRPQRTGSAPEPRRASWRSIELVPCLLPIALASSWSESGLRLPETRSVRCTFHPHAVDEPTSPCVGHPSSRLDGLQWLSEGSGQWSDLGFYTFSGFAHAADAWPTPPPRSS